MAAPAVTGAVALYKASRPQGHPCRGEGGTPLSRQLQLEDRRPTLTRSHEPLLDVSRIWALGTFSIKPATATPPKVEAPLGGVLPITVGRSATFFERVRLSITSVPAGLTASLTPSSLIGWTATQASIAYTVAAGTPPGIYEIGVQGTNQGRTVTASIPVEVVQDVPTAGATGRLGRARGPGRHDVGAGHRVAGRRRQTRAPSRDTRSRSSAGRARGAAPSRAPRRNVTRASTSRTESHTPSGFGLATPSGTGAIGRRPRRRRS